MKKLLCTAVLFAAGMALSCTENRSALENPRNPQPSAIPAISGTLKLDDCSAIAARYPLRGRTSSFFAKSARPA
jgi:hypothetical protein